MPERKRGRHGELNRAERAAIECGNDKDRSAREVARDLGRSSSSIADEVRRNRTVTCGPGKGGRVGSAPEDAYPRLLAWPHMCRGGVQEEALPLLAPVEVRALRRPRPVPGRRATLRCPPGRKPLRGGEIAEVAAKIGADSPEGCPGPDIGRQALRVLDGALHRLPLDRARLRRHVQHGPAPQGGLQGEEGAAGPSCCSCPRRHRARWPPRSACWRQP